jgi:DmsE family decaheme c-type cytochrome
VAFGAKTRDAIEGENATCLGCHQGGRRLYWPGSAHDQRDVACTSCHTVMKQISRRSHLGEKTEIETCGSCHLLPRAQLFRNAHMPLRPEPIHEGFMSCSSCHNPHGTVTAHLIPHDSVNDGCYSCHAEKRGPFLWEHPPVNENCLNCHAPHGSTRESMLKLSLPRLCQQCHIEVLHPTEARRPTNKFVIGNACLHCHQNIHGSNHPSGFAFTR